MSVTRKEILISDAALGYLQSSEIEQAFCGECPWNDSRQGRELFTGLPTPPSQECPADFDLGSDRCAMKSQFAEVVETLADADKLAGLKRNVKIILKEEQGMTRKEKLLASGNEILWERGDDELFLIQDGGDFWFVNFYENNEGERMVDEFYIDDPDDFDPEAFDFINGVPDNTEPENEFWA